MSASSLKTTSLGAILTDEQLMRVKDIAEKHRSLESRVSHLRKFLKTIEPELNSKGIHPDYLAYLIGFALEQPH